MCVGTTYLFDWDQNLSVAVDEFTKAIEANPNSSGAYHQRGKALGMLGDWQGAVADWDKALEVNPQATPNYGLLCSAYVEHLKEQYEEAIADCTRALDDNPDWAWGYYYIGIAYKELGDEQQAISSFQEALKLFEEGRWQNADMAARVRSLLQILEQ